MASKGTLTLRILGDEKPLAKSMGKAEGILKTFAKAGPAIFAGLGLAAGAVFVNQFGKAMERGRMQDRLAAQLNLTEDEAEKAGQIAGDLYADAYGDSLGQVHDAVGAVMSSLGDLDDGDVEDLTAKALDLAAAFDVDVNESVNAAGVLLRTGLAKDADQAFDLIVSGMQQVPAQMRGELIPIIEEYAQHFDALGIDGEEAFGLLVKAAGEGRQVLDKTGDALKEFAIRSTDMSTASQEAYEAVGLDAEEMAGKILQGGDTARGALDDIVEGLLSMENPTERATAAVALFGTPLEDLSVSEIPAFLRSMVNMEDGMGQVEGAATDMGNTLNDNAATKIESFKRKAGKAISDWVYVNVLPAAEEVMDAFEEDGIGGAVDKAIELWEQAQPRVQAWWDGTFVPWWENTAVPWAAYIGGELGTGLINGILDGLAASLPGLLRWADTHLSGAFGGMFGGLDIVVPDNLSAPDVSNPVSRPTGPPSGATLGDDRPGGVFHSGGMITSNLPRARGGRLDEHDIRVQTGERVMSRREVAAGGRGGGGMVMNVTVQGSVISEGDLARKLAQHFRELQRRGGTLGFSAA